MKDNYKGDGAKFFLVIADIIRRDNVHKLQTGRFQLDVKKSENVQEMVEHWNMGFKSCETSDLGVIKNRARLSPG